MSGTVHDCGCAALGCICAGCKNDHCAIAGVCDACCVEKHAGSCPLKFCASLTPEEKKKEEHLNVGTH